MQPVLYGRHFIKCYSSFQSKTPTTALDEQKKMLLSVIAIDKFAIRKKVGEGYYYVVEAVPDSEKKRLHVVSAYINKKDTSPGRRAYCGEH